FQLFQAFPQSEGKPPCPNGARNCGPCRVDAMGPAANRVAIVANNKGDGVLPMAATFDTRKSSVPFNQNNTLVAVIERFDVKRFRLRRHPTVSLS
ncbi:MAG: hypothetical protein WBX25_35890, partial [Rhodomicrobium sp.]